MPKLLLFDIDGTLIHSGGAGRLAIKRAFEALYGDSRPIDRMDFSGRTDSGIFTTVLRELGQESDMSGEKYAAAVDLYLSLLKDAIETAPRKRVLPGIVQLLSILSQTRGLYLGLLTGNFEAGARIKLEPFQLNDYFPVGGFSDAIIERSAVARQAALNAGNYFGVSFEPTDVYVIGDTERDIDCGRANGFRTVAVATGNRSVDMLAQHAPDYLFESFADYEAALGRLGMEGNNPHTIR